MNRTAPQRFRPPPTAIGALGALAAAATALVVTGVAPLPDIDGMLEDASRTLGAWAYPAVAGFALLETGAFVGLVVPGETAVVVGGVVAARGEVELVPLIGLVWIAAGTGDLVSFLLGRRLGRPFLARHGARMRLGPERLVQVERFYARHGGKAVLVGRFAGLVRAVSPFLAGASGLALRRFLPWSLAGALLWSVTFILVGYAFSESFAQSGETAARIALALALTAALAYAVVALVRSRSGRLRGRGRTKNVQRDQRAERSQAGADDRTGDHIEREVHAQVDAGQGHGRGNPERERAQPRTEDRHGGGGGEGGRAVSGGEGRVVGDGGERTEVGVRDGRPFAPEQILEARYDERSGSEGDRRGSKGHRHAPAPEVGAEPEADEQRSLHPPGRENHEPRGEPGMLKRGRRVDERTVEVEQEKHRRDQQHASTAKPLLLVVNGRASGIPDPHALGEEFVAVLEELGADADLAVTLSEEELWDALRSAESEGRRVVLVGGDGTLHAAANAPLARLPDLALVPAGRANNIARALGLPSNRVRALAVAANMPARPVDALRVATPDRLIYALEALSAGFQAEARAGYESTNSGDLRQGVRALMRAVRRYRPYRAAVRIGDREIASNAAAQLFLSNLPYFGFGFEVDPGADPADGRFEAILLEARGRGRLLRLLAAARRGRHLGRRGVLRLPATRARLTEPLPLVADAVPLGTTTATVTMAPARLRVASPALGAAA